MKAQINILNPEGKPLHSIEIEENAHYFIGKVKDPYRPEYQVLRFEDARPVFDYLGYSQKEVAEVLEVNASTLSRWNKTKKEEPMGKLQSRVVNKIDEIIARGIKIFGSEENFKSWLDSPNYALGDQRPVDLLKDPYQLENVESALEAISWGSIL